LLSDRELITVQEISAKLDNPLTLYINRGADPDRYQTALLNIAVQINGVSNDSIRLEEWSASVFPEKTSLTFGPEQNIIYFAAPLGREFQPFMDAIAWAGKALPGADKKLSRELARIEREIKLTVLIAEACPHCPQAVRSALALAVAQPKIKLTVIDASYDERLAERYKVKSTPTIVVDDGLSLVGGVSGQDLVNLLLKAVSGNLTEVIDSMIKNGRAEEAGALICNEMAPEAVIPIYTAPEFSNRMGALVAMEEALSINPRIFDPIVQDLTKLLLGDDMPLRGDTAELLGKIGDPAALPALEKALSDPDPDVREAVEEAIENIKSCLV
jgi:alkyl hydroperoxide reductase subunit AhpF